MKSWTRRDFVTRVAASSTAPGLLATKSSAHSSQDSATRPISDRLGITHVDGGYYFTDEDYLNEGAKQVRKIGSRVIKTWFHYVSSEDETKYPYNSEWPKSFDSMVDIATHPYYEELFRRDFRTYVLVAYAMDEDGNYWRGQGGTHYFMHGVDESQLRVEEDSFYELTKHLLETYRGTEKEFILQHWQGDWAILPHDIRQEISANNIQADDPEPTSTAIDGMTRWLNARQRGVERARQEVESDVRVLHAVEVNMVLRAKQGQKRVITDVVPETNVDLVAHNSYREMWKAQKEWDPREISSHFREILDYVNEHAPDPDEYTRKTLVNPERNVFIGEYGLPHSIVGTKKASYISKLATNVSLDWGATWTLFWQIYDNEGGKGFWLIRPDGSRTPLYEYFSEAIAKNALFSKHEFDELLLDFSRAVPEHKINSDVDKEDSRWLTFACSKVELVGSDGSILSTYDIGNPDKEPIFMNGVSWPGQNKRTWRWFVGESETKADTSLFIPDSVLNAAATLRLTGRPAPEGDISARVVLNGEEVESVDFPRNAGWRKYTVELEGEKTTDRPTETSTPTQTATSTDIPPTSDVVNGSSTVTTTTESTTPGFGFLAAIAGVTGAELLRRSNDSDTE